MRNLIVNKYCKWWTSLRPLSHRIINPLPLMVSKKLNAAKLMTKLRHIYKHLLGNPGRVPMFFLLTNLGLINLSWAVEPVVITNPQAPVDIITSVTATQIFLKKLRTWPDGRPIQPIDLKEGSVVRNDFYTNIIGRSPAQLRAYWARQVFTGMGFPPKQVSNSKEANIFVGNTPGAVGYVNKPDVATGVKIVLESR